MRSVSICLLLALAGVLGAAEPVLIDVGKRAPDRLTDRMQVLFDAFEERAALASVPSKITVRWDDVSYSLRLEDWWDYRSGRITFLQVVARVGIQADPPHSPAVLWRRYRWVLLPVLGGVLLLVLVLVLAFRKSGKAAPAAPLNQYLSLWPASGGVIPLTRPRIALGAAAGNDVLISGPGVAPFHARIWRNANGAVFIEDLGSPAGTVLSGRRVTKEWLAPGAVIVLGAWQARVAVWTAPGTQR
jgi:hypothetical protein